MIPTIHGKAPPALLLPCTMVLLAAACNMHLLRGVAPSALIYTSDGLRAGQWYRLLTHPLVHVSWYHLLMDSCCMMLLFAAVKISIPKKLMAFGICGASSLLYALAASPHIASTGYCGLSGIAHGFMFLAGWVWLRKTNNYERPGRLDAFRLFGFLFCLVSLSKSLWEVYAGQILFIGSHPGYLGTPIVHAHLGGVIGGFFSTLLVRKTTRAT